MKKYIILLLIALIVTAGITRLGGSPFGHNIKFFFNFFYGFSVILFSRSFKNKILYYSITLLPPAIISFLIFQSLNWDFYRVAIPSTLALFLGIGAGIAALFLESKRSLFVLVGLSLVLNCFALFDGYDYWVHRSNYGTFTGKQSIPIKNVMLQNEQDSLEKFDKAGQYYLFDFWTTSCGLCIREFPEVQKLYEKYRQDNANLSIYLVKVPRDTTDRRLSKEILRKREISIPLLFFPGLPEERVEKYRVFSYPTVLLIKDDEIIHIGNIKSVTKRLKSLL